MSDSTDTDTEAEEQWKPPREPVTWELSTPLRRGQVTYPTITLRAPTAGDVLKASAVRGISSMEMTLRLIVAISAENVPYEALLDLPAWMVDRMSRYMDSFLGGPMLPTPLQSAPKPPLPD